MKIKWLLFIIMTLILLLAIPLAGCASSPSEPKAFPPPEGYSSWDEYYGESQQQPASTTDWEISNVGYTVIEKNDSWWKFSWQLTLKNNTSSTVNFSVIVNFIDQDGLIIKGGRENPPEFAPNEERTIEGFVQIDTELASDVYDIEATVTSASIQDETEETGGTAGGAV